MDPVALNNELGQDEFLRLLVTQLRNQDPLNPIQNEEFIAQLAQFSTLEGIEKLNASFADLLALQQLTEGASLLGKVIEYQLPGSSTLIESVVNEVTVQDARLLLNTVNGDSVHVSEVQSLSSPPGDA